MEPSDKELLKQIQMDHSQAAFNQLVERHQMKVLHTCQGFVNNLADAEDITQDVFVEVLRSIGTFRGDSLFSTWLYRIAINKSLNFLSKKKRERLFWSFDGVSGRKGDEAANIPADETFSTDSNLRQSENRKLLKRAINSLPKNQRIAFILSKYQELSYKEIADTMELSLSAVESLLFRAKGNLQKYLLKKM